ncbi:uncharacterized protein ACNLHF_004061 [Anomaloglossus baeobatrachus]
MTSEKFSAKIPASILRRRTGDFGCDGAEHKPERRVRFSDPEAIYIHAPIGTKEDPWVQTTANENYSVGFRRPFIIGVCILTIMGLILYCHHSQLSINAFSSSFVVFLLRLKHNAAICWNFLKKATIKQWQDI